jgi:hypothetical protein
MASSVDDLQEALREALAVLHTETSLDAEALFGERVVRPEEMTAPAAHAAGLIEGAAIALGVTALELLDEVDAR